MPDVLRDLSPAALTAAVHNSLVEHVLDIPRILPEWQLSLSGPCTLVMHRHAPTPLDGVFRARLEPATADAQIAAVRQRFAREGRSLLWLTGAPDEPPDLPQRLAAQGIQPQEVVPGMAADLSLLPQTEPLPAGLTIEPVRDAPTHAALAAIQVQTLGEAFGARAALKRAFGLDPDASVQHYLGRLAGRPVAAATAVYSGGVVSLWGIGTLPEARGGGIGRALTLHACLEASRRGYRVATLHATPSGEPVYRRLGFARYGQMQFCFTPAP